MTTISGHLAAVSWGTGFVGSLVSTHSGPVAFSLTQTADTPDSTRFTSTTGGSIWEDSTVGLRSWSGSLRMYLPTPRIGSTGLVTYGTYGGFMDQYDLTINCKTEENTRFASVLEWKSFHAGILSWAGTMEGPYDSTALLPGAGRDAEPASATFQVKSGGTGKTLSGSIITTSVSHDVDPQNMVKAKFAFKGKGPLATAGTATELWAADSGGAPPHTLTTPQIDQTLSLTTYTDHVYSGPAIFTSLGLQVAFNQQIELTVNFLGIGALSGLTGV